MEARCTGVLLLSILSQLPAAAIADLPSGSAAYERGDYAQARELLSEPSLADDGEALMLLARMAHEGWGGPVDEVAAYVHLTRIVMLWRQDQVDEAVAARQVVAARMSRAEITLAEERLSGLVEKTWGKAELSAELAKAIRTLEACTERCSQQAGRLRVLGPSARPAIAALERVLTRDPYWLSRAAYFNALYTIGTAAVPALCRTVEDRVELAQEGPYNLTNAAYALGALGPVATDGRDCLIGAMDSLPAYASTFREQHGAELDYEAMLKEAEEAIALALVQIGDPDRMSYEAVRRSFDAAEGSRAFMLSAVLGLTYGELRPAIDLSRGVLESGSFDDKNTMLRLLANLSSHPGFPDDAAALRPVLAPLSQDRDPAIRSLASELLEVIGEP